MSRHTVLLTGGSACGKSTYSRRLALSGPAPRYYVLTADCAGEVDATRIESRRRMADDDRIRLVERARHLDRLVLPGCSDQQGTVVVDCLCNLLSNEMFDADRNWHDAADEVIEQIRSLAARVSFMVVVTNEIDAEPMDTECLDTGTLAYIEALSKIGSRLSASFDETIELVSGIPLTLKA